MKTLLLSCAVLAGAALTATSASAEMLNQWLLDQLNTSAASAQTQVQAQTLAQGQPEAVKIRASLVQAPREMRTGFQPTSVPAGQPIALQPVNSAPVPLI